MYGWDSGKKLPLSLQLHVSLRDPYTQAEFPPIVARSTRTLSSDLAPLWTWTCMFVPKVPTYPSVYRRGTAVELGKDLVGHSPWLPVSTLIGCFPSPALETALLYNVLSREGFDRQ